MLIYINNEAHARITPSIMFLRRLLECAPLAALVSAGLIFSILASQIILDYNVKIYFNFLSTYGFGH